jgi:hypothetical protein
MIDDNKRRVAVGGGERNEKSLACSQMNSPLYASLWRQVGEDATYETSVGTFVAPGHVPMTTLSKVAASVSNSPLWKMAKQTTQQARGGYSRTGVVSPFLV